MRHEWEYKSFDKRKIQLKPYQIEPVKGFEDIVLVTATGDYARKLDGEVYEILYTKAVAGQPPKSIEDRMKQYATVENAFVQSAYEPAKALRKDLENMFLYGSGAPAPVLGHILDVMDDVVGPTLDEAIAQQMKKPSGILSMFGTVEKEKEMVIGGNECHLCGAKMLQKNLDIVYKKKDHTRITKLYECGTLYEESFKSHEGYEKENLKTHITLGSDCIEID